MASKRVNQKDARSEPGTIAVDLSSVAMHLYTHSVGVKSIFWLQVDHIAVEGVTSMAKKVRKKQATAGGRINFCNRLLCIGCMCLTAV